MAEGTFTFRVDDELKARFAEVAANQERTAAQLLRVLMKDAVHRDRELREHDRWFRSEIEHALSEADDLTRNVSLTSRFAPAGNSRARPSSSRRRDVPRKDRVAPRGRPEPDCAARVDRRA